MKIELEILEKAFKEIFQHLKNQGITGLEIEEDFYWNIDSQERYNPYKDPSNFNLGQLEDNWQEIIKISKAKSEPISYSLVWLSTLLRILGEKLIS